MKKQFAIRMWKERQFQAAVPALLGTVPRSNPSPRRHGRSTNARLWRPLLLPERGYRLQELAEAGN